VRIVLYTEIDLFVAETLRALYLADNDFETLPADIGKLINLEIVSSCESEMCYCYHQSRHVLVSMVMSVNQKRR